MTIKANKTRAKKVTSKVTISFVPMNTNKVLQNYALNFDANILNKLNIGLINLHIELKKQEQKNDIVELTATAQITLTMYEKVQNDKGNFVAGNKIKSVQITEKMATNVDINLFKVDTKDILLNYKKSMLKNAKDKTNIDLINFLNSIEANQENKVIVKAKFLGAFFLNGKKLSAKDTALVND